MITNLLDKVVKLNSNPDIMGKICAIFGENEHGFSVAFADLEGKIHTCYISQCTMHDDNIHYVVLFWAPQEKIKAIKCVRSILGLDLRGAKDFVESQPSRVMVKANLTLLEAEEIKRRITHDDNMECDIRTKLKEQG